MIDTYITTRADGAVTLAPSAPGDEPFGWQLIIGLHGCTPDVIADVGQIETFARELCDLIDMRPYGPPATARFGYAMEKTAGYSLTQLIESSLISGHFSEARRSASLNVFSCLPFDADLAAQYAAGFFGGTIVQQVMIVCP